MTVKQKWRSKAGQEVKNMSSISRRGVDPGGGGEGAVAPMKILGANISFSSCRNYGGGAPIISTTWKINNYVKKCKNRYKKHYHYQALQNH